MLVYIYLVEWLKLVGIASCSNSLLFCILFSFKQEFWYLYFNKFFEILPLQSFLSTGLFDILFFQFVLISIFSLVNILGTIYFLFVLWYLPGLYFYEVSCLLVFYFAIVVYCVFIIFFIFNYLPKVLYFVYSLAGNSFLSYVSFDLNIWGYFCFVFFLSLFLLFIFVYFFIFFYCRIWVSKHLVLIRSLNFAIFVLFIVFILPPDFLLHFLFFIFFIGLFESYLYVYLAFLTFF